MKISDMSQAQQIEHLVSVRDRMVTISRRTGDPMYRGGLELIATVTVGADSNGEISIGIGSTNPDDVIEVQFIDDEGEEG